MSDLIKVVYLNGDGGGFAKKKYVSPGTTVGQFLDAQLQEDYEDDVELQNPEKWDIRHNSGPAIANTVLQEGARITVAPTKVGGA